MRLEVTGTPISASVRRIASASPSWPIDRLIGTPPNTTMSTPALPISRAASSVISTLRAVSSAVSRLIASVVRTSVTPSGTIL